MNEITEALVHINDKEKIICLYGNVTDEQIIRIKEYKPKYTIAKFISGNMAFGSNIEDLIMQNI